MKNIGRIKWRSRRGLLELDLLLVPFANCMYATLPEAMQQTYCCLLEEEDQDILGWLQGHLDPPARYLELVACIMQWNASRD